MTISRSKEDYIRAIYNLKGEKQKVSNKDIAMELSVTAASVTEMNRRLVKENLLNHYPYKGVQLTEKGVLAANQLIRKHRLWEVFLYEYLNFQWGEVHAEADRLEHASSDQLVEKLSAFLGHPKFDPHGEIIPNPDGTVDKHKNSLILLSEIPENSNFTVKEVVDDKELLNYLFKKGLQLNHHYKLVNRNTYDFTIKILHIETNKEINISEKAANKIKVKYTKK